MSEPTTRDWIITFPVIKPALSNESSLETVTKEAEMAIQVLLTKSHKAYHVWRYASCLWSGSEGSVSHLLAMTDNMVALAHRFWMDIYMSRKKINHIHIIASGNAAIFAIKFLAFFAQHVNHLENYTTEEFDQNWNFFPFSDLNDRFPVNPLFRSLTLIHPSLPMPSFLAHHLLNLPDIYCLTSRPAPRPEVEILCVFTSNDSAQQNIDINVDWVFELPLHNIEKVLTGLWLNTLPVPGKHEPVIGSLATVNKKKPRTLPVRWWGILRRVLPSSLHLLATVGNSCSVVDS